MKRGRFITLEGIEGAGKSTHIETIRATLAAAGHEVIVTREPGGTVISERIRTILLDSDGAMNSETELLLMFAARAEHLAAKIRPALACGAWVVCDRFTDSTYAYQGGGRGFSLDRIAILEHHVQGDFRPDWTILFDIDVPTGLARAGRRGQADRFEREDIAFFTRVQNVFQDRAAGESGRFRIIDSRPPVERVEAALRELLAEFVAHT